VLTQQELEEQGYTQRPIVTLRDSPAKAIAEVEGDGQDGERDVREGQGIGVQGSGWVSRGLGVGVGGEEVLGRWMGWSRGVQFDVVDGGLVKLGRAKSKF
jgi:alpha-methylacyl-CoA racemase